MHTGDAMSFPLATVSIVLVGSTLAVACGGSILAEERTDDAGVATAPDAEAVATSDAAPPDAATPEAGCGDVDALLHAWSSPSWNGGGFMFTRKEDCVLFFEALARSNDLVVPAHEVDCSPAGVAAGQCTYDPLTARIDAEDVHYSGPLDEFTGPDDAPWVWYYIADQNDWFAASDAQAPAAYQLLVLANECAAQ